MKVLVLVIFSLIAISINAQFKATETGLVSASDNKDYYVVEVQNKSASELYNSVNSFVVSSFKNPDAVANRIEGEMINIHGSYPNAFSVKKALGLSSPVNLDMNLIVRFKDGRIRFDSPTINRMYIPGTLNAKDMDYVFSGGMGKFVGETSLFDKKGKPKDKKMIEGLETFINALVNSIVDTAKGSSDDNW